MVQQREARLINEWMAAKHPLALQWKRVRVGPLPNLAMGRAFGVTQRWVDAVFLEDDVIHLVEAKMRPDAGALGQLRHYQELFRQTPEFGLFKDKPIRMIFLTTRPDALLEHTASFDKIEYVVFAPAWVQEMV